MDVGGWLRSLGLEQYEASFRENEINDKVLPSLTAEDLKDLGVVMVGHRRMLLDAVAALRMEAAKDPSDPGLAQLVGELSVSDPDFRAWWAEHQVNSASYGTKHYQHRTVGSLTLDCDTWDSPDGSGQRLMVLTAEPGTPSYDALRILASWTTSEASATTAPGD